MDQNSGVSQNPPVTYYSRKSLDFPSMFYYHLSFNVPITITHPDLKVPFANFPSHVTHIPTRSCQNTRSHQSQSILSQTIPTNPVTHVKSRMAMRTSNQPRNKFLVSRLLFHHTLTSTTDNYNHNVFHVTECHNWVTTHGVNKASPNFKLSQILLVTKLWLKFFIKDKKKYYYNNAFHNN